MTDDPSRVFFTIDADLLRGTDPAVVADALDRAEFDRSDECVINELAPKKDVRVAYPGDARGEFAGWLADVRDDCKLDDMPSAADAAERLHTAVHDRTPESLECHRPERAADAWPPGDGCSPDIYSDSELVAAYRRTDEWLEGSHSPLVGNTLYRRMWDLRNALFDELRSRSDTDMPLCKECGSEQWRRSVSGSETFVCGRCREAPPDFHEERVRDSVDAVVRSIAAGVDPAERGDRR